MYTYWETKKKLQNIIVYFQGESGKVKAATKQKNEQIYFSFISLLSSLCLSRFHESFIAAYVNSCDTAVYVLCVSCFVI